MVTLYITSLVLVYLMNWSFYPLTTFCQSPLPSPAASGKQRFRYQFSSVQFSCSVVSNSLRPHESQHARPPCPSPTPGVHWDSDPSSQWCHPAISSSVVPFSSCTQSLPASESFPMSQLLAWGGQSTGDSALASFLPKKSQGWPPSEWTGWISLQSKGLSRVFSSAIKRKSFESYLMRWMNLEPIIQSEVSQREKYKYRI